MASPSEEGVIKFTCDWKETPSLPRVKLNDILYWRAKCYALGWIGVYEDGIGYGNISFRSHATGFIISGSGTGRYKSLHEGHFTQVKRIDLKRNWLQCQGPIIASSESLTHGAVYDSHPDISHVIHLHHADLWRRCISKIPATPANIAYGTPAMAQAMALLIHQSGQSNGAFAMAGHKEGLLAYGCSFHEAFKEVIQLFSI